jgi:CDGSH-type Zn-finger protein
MSTKVTISKNGPLLIQGDISIVDPAGKAYDLNGKSLVALCRCGQSRNKPFCDGNHSNGFEHEPRAFEANAK